MTTVTPSMARGIAVTPRRPPFEFDTTNVPEHWCGGDPVATAAWNALSVIASAGEKLFVDAGRYLIERTDDPTIAAETRAFLQQEGTHSAVHARFNRVLAERGLPVAATERFAADLLDAVDRFAGRATMLSTALAGEQLIGEIGHALLERPEVLAHAAPAPRALWMWHFYEEVEHQAALHDGWMHVFGASPGARTHRVLGAAYLAVLLGALWPTVTWAMLRPVRRGRRPLAWSPAVRLFFGRSGLMRGTGGNLVHLVRSDFHPFQLHDPAASLARNRHLVDARWEAARPTAGRHGTATDVPELPALKAQDLQTLAAYTAYVARRTRAYVAEV